MVGIAEERTDTPSFPLGLVSGGHVLRPPSRTIKLSRQETPNGGGGAKGDETSGGDDDDDDTEMRAQRSRHIRAHIWRHT